MSALLERTQIVAWAETTANDLTFERGRQWVEAGGRAIGMLPVWAPHELIWAAGMLPVGIHGGGDRLDIIRGDAYYQSYICHLPRSVVELIVGGRLDFLSGCLFPATCDVIRNLSGMYRILKPGALVRYVDLPQDFDPASGGKFFATGLRELATMLGELRGSPIQDAELFAAISLYNRRREVVRALYARRRDEPWNVPSDELYLLLRAGETVPPGEWIPIAEQYLAICRLDGRKRRDTARVIVVGAFCEQPPIGLIRTVERSGCSIVDDDFLIGNRFLTADVPIDGPDPFEALARTTLAAALPSPILYEPDPTAKRLLIVRRLRAARAEGVIFAAPSFCDPALLDRPMLQAGADAHGIPYISFKYAENSGQFQQFREQAGTFSDALKLWAGA